MKLIRCGVTLLGILGLASLMITSSGCSKSKQQKPDTVDDSTATETVNAHLNLNGDSDSGQAGGLSTIYFPYDSFTLNTDTKRALRENIDVLKSQANVNIQVEGHCDERGSIQYNIALGEKRANAVRKYLIDNGISKNRISTISFGKERPLDSQSSESAWSKNRRANFVITSIN